ncbi:cytochrome P450 [Paraphaeosphaeria sporulosa]|uniref:Cytochrome P450 n=1 Tax=Paraphaeosphaeria sporulosa TaxID=1460663 RepID=A0A177C524_9PLEO|nr:cytochrome P450 [Paraphaeosphaeria sporulosa]OAG01780.1 cytochrome P450 [Paraphaeosphaeria sporulosa]
MGLVLKAVCAYVLYVISRAIYNAFFHPLARFPGPKAWSASRIPYLFTLVTGQNSFRIKALHDEYGPVVRVAPNELHINDPRAWNDIYMRKDSEIRPPQWGMRPPGIESYNVISGVGSDHGRFRKALGMAFSEEAVKEYEPTVRSYFNKFTARIDELIAKNKGSAVVDMVKWSNFTTFDIIGELAWSKSYDCLDTGAGHAIMGVLSHFQGVIIAAAITYYPWINNALMAITPRSAFEDLKMIFNDGHERLQNRIKHGPSGHPDVLGHLAEYNKQNPTAKITDDEIEQNVFSCLVAGSECLTTAFSGAFHYLLVYPSKLKRAQEEVRAAFSSEASINATDAAKLEYLNAVIEESLRLCPPLPDMLRRQLPSEAPTTIAGRVIPPNTVVSVSCYSMFRSASHFSSPDTFAPERFLKSADESEKWSPDSPLNHNDMAAFKPWGVGPRECPAQPLARLEMRLFLAVLLYRYDLKVAEGSYLTKWTSQQVFETWQKDPLNVEFSPAVSSSVMAAGVAEGSYLTKWTSQQVFETWQKDPLNVEFSPAVSSSVMAAGVAAP